MTNSLDLFASALRSARTKRGLTQRTLAERLNMSVRTIIEIERCRSNPKFETIVLLAQELNISLDAIAFPNMVNNTVSKSVSDFLSTKMSPNPKSILLFVGKQNRLKKNKTTRSGCCLIALFQYLFFVTPGPRHVKTLRI